MAKRTFASLVGLAGLLAMFLPANADDGCHLKLLTSLPLGADAAGGATAPVSINGQSVNFLVDTGGIITMVTDKTSAALKLPTEATPNSGLSMYGGKALRRVAMIAELHIGRLAVHGLNYPVLPADFHLPPEDDGILAPDLLGNFDMDFDFAKAKLNLFSPDHCEGKVVYWAHDTSAVAVVPFDTEHVSGDWDQLLSVPHIQIHVQIDGHDVTATVDTGSSQSLMDLETAEDMFSLTEKSPGMTSMSGSGGAKVYRRTFKSLSFSGVQVANPEIVLVPKDVSRTGANGPALILGMDVLRQLHLYIAFKEKNIYVTPAGAQ